MRLESNIDSASLPQDEAQALKTELENAHFFALPDQLAAKAGGADRFQYEITVEDGGNRHTIQAGEAALPDTLQPLVQHLEMLARTRR